MRKWYVFLLAMTWSFCCSTADTGGLYAASGNSVSSTRNQETLIRVDMPAPSLKGNKLGDLEEQPLVVYLPPSYHKTQKRYPVVYFLPGYGDTVEQYTDGTYFDLKKAMDELVAAGKTGEMIVVIVNGYNKLGGCFYNNSPVTGNWEDYVVKDAVGYVDSRYRTLKGPLSRGLAGHSMGGFGALRLAMKHPGVFSCVYSMSPSLFAPNGAVNALSQWSSIPEWGRYIIMAMSASFSPNPDASFPYADIPSGADDPVLKKWDAGLGDIAGKIKKYKDGLKTCKTIGLEVGTADEYRWIVDGTRLMRTSLESAGIKVVYAEFDGNHTGQLGTRMKSTMLPFMSTNLKFE